MRLVMRGLVVFGCVTLGLTAAADTLAYWNGDLAAGSTKAGWTVSAGTGVTLDTGTATTTKQDGGTANTGIILTPAETVTSDILTLVFKYSNLDVCSHNVSMASLVWGNGTTMNDHVARIVGKAQCGMSNGGSQLNAANYAIPDAGLMAISLSNAGGMRISFKATDVNEFTAAAWYTGSDVKLGTQFGAIKVGGCGYNIGTYHRPGMTIESVAILNEVIDTGSVYEIPSDGFSFPGQITTTAKLLPNMTMAQLKDAKITACTSAAHIDRKNVTTVATQMKGDVATAMTNEFQIVDGQWVKAIAVEYTPAAGGVNAKALCARYLAKAQIANFPSLFDQTGNGTTGWNTSAVVATSATSTAGGTNYGFANLMVTPAGEQKIILTDTNWSDVELGEAKLVSVANGATLTFAEGATVPADVVFGSMKNDVGLNVAGTVPVLTATEPLTIPEGATATIAPAYTGTVIVKGTYDIKWTNGNTNLENPTIVLAGGTLANSGTAGVSYGAIGISKISLTDDSTITSDRNFYSIASSYNEFDFGLNGHTLTKSGSGEYVIKTGKFVGGGTLAVETGTLTLQAAKLDEGDELSVSVEEGATLQFTNGDGKQLAVNGTINLVKGAFKAPENVTLDVAVPEGMELVKETTNNVTTYSFKVPDPEPEYDPDNDAVVDEVKYASIEGALLHLSGGKILKVLRDVTLDHPLVIDGLVDGTIDLNGHSIANTGDGDVVTIQAGAVVTITGEGSIEKEDSEYAIASAGLTTISGANGTPVIGGIVAAPSSRSKVSFAADYFPASPVKAKLDWTGCVSNSKTPVLSMHHTAEHPYSSIVSETVDPIQEIDGTLYEAEFSGGFVSDTERVLIFTYLYTVAEVTVDASHVTIPYVFNVATDPETEKTYARIAKATAAGTMNGKPLFSYTPMPADINFKVQPDDGYQNPTVKANGATVEPAETGYYHITAVEGGVNIVVTAEAIPQVPAYVPADKVAEYNTWKTTHAAALVSATDDQAKAGFFLNCAPTDDAIGTARTAFVIEIEMGEDNTPHVTVKGDYIVEPVIKGSATVDGDYTLPVTDPTARFFKATLGE